MELGNPVVLGINTAFLYLLVAALAGLLIFFLLRRRRQAGTGETGPFAKQSREEKRRGIKRLFRRFPALEEAVVWMNAQLLRMTEQPAVTVTVEQEWCCQDLSGEAKAPARCRPSRIEISAEDIRLSHAIKGYSPENFLSEEENKLLNWGVLERCRLVFPFYGYRVEVHRTRRCFQLNGKTPAAWEQAEAVMEEYTIHIVK